ncbi:hypothetical protein F5X96DRAFT_624340 [Biscogniauxia mediterranea]|nr:hypothetical protein F5X96DRAFT_624340 [Biscogniauxia mediterranea]
MSTFIFFLLKPPICVRALVIRWPVPLLCIHLSLFGSHNLAPLAALPTVPKPISRSRRALIGQLAPVQPVWEPV